MQILLQISFQTLQLSSIKVEDQRNCLYHVFKETKDIRMQFSLTETSDPFPAYCTYSETAIFINSIYSNFSLTADIELVNNTGKVGLFAIIMENILLEDSDIKFTINNANDTQLSLLAIYDQYVNIDIVNSNFSTFVNNATPKSFFGLFNKSTANIVLEFCQFTATINTKDQFIGLIGLSKQLLISNCTIKYVINTQYFVGLAETVTENFTFVNSVITLNVTGSLIAGMLKFALNIPVLIQLVNYSVNLTGTNDSIGFIYESQGGNSSIVQIISCQIQGNVSSQIIPAMFMRNSFANLTLQYNVINTTSFVISATEEYGALVYQVSSSFRYLQNRFDYYMLLQSLMGRSATILYEALPGSLLEYSSNGNAVGNNRTQVNGTYSDCPCLYGDCGVIYPSCYTLLTEDIPTNYTNLNLGSGIIVQSITTNTTQSVNVKCYSPFTSLTVDLNNSIVRVNNYYNVQITFSNAAASVICANRPIFYRIQVISMGVVTYGNNHATIRSIYGGMFSISFQDIKVINCYVFIAYQVNAKSDLGGIMGYHKTGNVQMWNVVFNGSYSPISNTFPQVFGSFAAFVEAATLNLTNCSVNTSFINSSDTFGGFIGIVRSGATIIMKNCLFNGTVAEWSLNNVNTFSFVTTQGGIYGIVQNGANVTNINVTSQGIGTYSQVQCAYGSITTNIAPGIICKLYKILLTVSNFSQTENQVATGEGTFNVRYAIRNTVNVNNSIISIKDSISYSNFGTLQQRQIFFNIELTNDGIINISSGSFAGALTCFLQGTNISIINVTQGMYFYCNNFMIGMFAVQAAANASLINSTITATITGNEIGLICHQIDNNKPFYVINVSVSGYAISSQHASLFVRTQPGGKIIIINMNVTGDIKGINTVGIVGRLQAGSLYNVTNVYMQNYIEGQTATGAFCGHVNSNSAGQVVIILKDCTVKSEFNISTNYRGGAAFGWIQANTSVSITNVTVEVTGGIYGACPQAAASPFQITGITCILPSNAAVQTITGNVMNGNCVNPLCLTNVNFNYTTVKFAMSGSASLTANQGFFSSDYHIFQDVIFMGTQQLATTSGNPRYGGIVQTTWRWMTTSFYNCFNNITFQIAVNRNFAMGVMLERSEGIANFLNLTVKTTYASAHSGNMVGYGGVAQDCTSGSTIYIVNYSYLSSVTYQTSNIYSTMAWIGGGSVWYQNSSTNGPALNNAGSGAKPAPGILGY